MVWSITIDRRFRGPTDSGNGGYVAGAVAEGVDGTATSTLRIPPPLDRPLSLQGDGSSSRLLDGEVVVAEAESAQLDLEVPHPPTLVSARAATRRFFVPDHVFPECFVCGPDRGPGDGLRIFAGPVDDGDMVAAPWVPDASLGTPGAPLDPRYVWAALDCPSYFGLGTAPIAVLGRLTTSIDSLPRIGDELIVFAWRVGADGRKLYAASALADTDGSILAKASAVWIELRSRP
jgi:hypothetical protein